MEEKKVQQMVKVSFCERNRLNHTILLDYLQEENVNTEEIARLIYLYQKNSGMIMRWGVIYAACMDSGLFVPMEVSVFRKLLINLIPDFKIDRTTMARGVADFYMYSGARDDGQTLTADIITFINAKQTLEARLRSLGESK